MTKSLAEIAAEHGVHSRQRAHQIAKRAGVTKKPYPIKHPELYDEAWMQEHLEMPAREVAGLVGEGCTAATVNKRRQRLGMKRSMKEAA